MAFVRISYPILPSDNDAGLRSIESPKLVCSGTQDVEVLVANFGANPIDTVDINWELNGVAQPTFTLTSRIDSITTTISDTLLNLGAATFNMGVKHAKDIYF